MTLREALHQSSIPRHEAIALMSHATGLSSTEIALKSEQALRASCEALFFVGVQRRLRGEPLQYILGQWSFMGFDFNTDARALIPRPETEILVQTVLDYVWHVNRPGLHVLDLCAGSGCIGIALARLADIYVTAADISQDALSLAAENAALNHVTERMCFVQSDLFEALVGEKFDVIVSNPPYIPRGEMDALAFEVRDFEPLNALDGGTDGCDLYRRIIPESLRHLNAGGALFLEIGPPEVADMLPGAQVVNDYTGRKRVVWACV